MTKEKVFHELKAILMDDFEVEDSLISTSASLYEDLGLDSLDAIDLVVRISDTYNIDIDDKVIQEIQTIQQLVDAITARLNA